MIEPPMRDGAVVFEGGRVAEVGNAADIRRRHAQAHHIHLVNRAIVPGLINAHAHLELSHLRAEDLPHDTFVQWVVGLRAMMRGSELDPATSALEGARQSVRFGVTHIGDISRSCRATRGALRMGPARITSFGEALGLARLRPNFEDGLPGALDDSSQSDLLRIGLSPHSPYTVDLSGYRQCLELARDRGIPLATHLAEVPQEREFLIEQSGPLRGLWDQIGLWSDPVETFKGSPLEMARAVGLLEYPTLLAHVNDCTEEELAWLKQGNASVVYCPRTHAYFNRPAHPWRRMMELGINVAAGTDSCASSPDLNLLAELRLLHQQSPDVPVERIWHMGTINAARALRCDGGQIAPGGPADLVAFNVQGDDPLTEILENNLIPNRVWIGGTIIPPQSPQ
jgi:cytosine/adenosine deaminase-related metal-dependent hydrolase